MKISRRQLRRIISELYKVRGANVVHYGRDPDELEQKIIDIFISNGHQAVELAELALPGEEITKLVKEQISATRAFIEKMQWVKQRRKGFTGGFHQYDDNDRIDEHNAVLEATHDIHPRILESVYGAEVGELPKIVDQAIAYANAIIYFKTPKPYMERGWEALKAWAGVS
tara:strand:- start:405 stop:914 length:510 start_codon:yes stop_codon:yes gene_type:complete